MILPTWAAKKNLEAHESSAGEIADLFANADQKIKDCELISASEISTDTYQANVYGVAIVLMTANLRAAGYRTKKDVHGGHDTLIKCLGLTMDSRGTYSARIEAARTIRKQTTYVAIGNSQREEVDEFLVIVKELRLAVEKYIRQNYPKLINL